jgi:uncharacterized membrane protein
VSVSIRENQNPEPVESTKVVPPSPAHPHRPLGFSEDFKRFFTRGLAALLPTLITIAVIVWIWNFLWEALGRHLIFAIKWMWLTLAQHDLIAPQPAGYIGRYWADDLFRTRLVGVLLAIVAVYIVGLFVGNLIGRTVWKIGEVLVMKVPVIRAIYPAVKQVTDFVLRENKSQFHASRVVAVQPHEKGIWSIGLITGGGLAPLSDATGQEMVTVFVPSSPTAFSGYVLVVPRESVVELPLKVEEAMRLLISGGVLTPGEEGGDVPRSLREITLLRGGPAHQQERPPIKRTGS